MNRILLVEDASDYQKVVVRALGHHSITCVGSVPEARTALGQQSFDLVLLDINLPKQNGYALLAELQMGSPDLPVLCLTGRTELTDKVTAFSLGADDYIVKPFDPIELKARVDAKLTKNRRHEEQADLLTAGGISVNRLTQQVRVGEGAAAREISLTQTEFKLLYCLARRPEQVFSRDQLLVAAWGENTQVLDRVVDVHLCALRKKLGECKHYLRAVPGVGYKLTLEKPRAKKRAA